MNSIPFENSYLNLPEKFYSHVPLCRFEQLKMLLQNDDLMEELQISPQQLQATVQMLSLPSEQDTITPFAQAYAGHQFGYLNKLGDGRAMVLGEYLTANSERFDIQLKGSGRTPYSRNGDGKATLKSMLREYLISHAMHHLGIASSRSLAVLHTNETVQREELHNGALLIRIMKSHIRIGTFEWAAYFGQKADSDALLQYSIHRLYPELKEAENHALSFLEKVMKEQIHLQAEWMRVGFVHGVQNTDNVAISAETFDYGPCAFINAYHPDTVFSSIDTHGRYSFGNQPRILKWNLIKLANVLLPLIDDNQQKAIELAQQCIDRFDALWSQAYYGSMLAKIGIRNQNEKDKFLLDELLNIMQQNGLDYSHTFLALAGEIDELLSICELPALHDWILSWKERLAAIPGGWNSAIGLMRKNNPAYIPRNHQVEVALEMACNGDFRQFNKMLDVLANPYDYQLRHKEFFQAPDKSFEAGYQTFCGT